MNTNEAILKLAELVRADYGASDAARSVINYTYNNNRPIKSFYLLDRLNRKAAIVLIDRGTWVDVTLLRTLVPELDEWV